MTSKVAGKIEDGGTENGLNPQIVVRHLAAAEGYLELGLPGYALAELNTVADAGPFAPIAELFRGEALQAQEKACRRDRSFESQHANVSGPIQSVTHCSHSATVTVTTDRLSWLMKRLRRLKCPTMFLSDAKLVIAPIFSRREIRGAADF